MNTNLIIIDNFYNEPDIIRLNMLKNFETKMAIEKKDKNIDTWHAEEWHFNYIDYNYSQLPGLTDNDKTIIGRNFILDSLYDENLHKKEFEKLLNKKIEQTNANNGKGYLYNCLSNPIPIEINNFNNYNEKYDEWVGVLFLTPDAPSEGGITTYNYTPLKITSTEKILSYDENIKKNMLEQLNVNKFDISKYWEVDSTIENVYNRLVLLKKDLFYSSTCNFGTNLYNSRLLQYFSFSVVKKE